MEKMNFGANKILRNRTMRNKLKHTKKKPNQFCKSGNVSYSTQGPILVLLIENNSQQPRLDNAQITESQLYQLLRLKEVPNKVWLGSWVPFNLNIAIYESRQNRSSVLSLSQPIEIKLKVGDSIPRKCLK